MLKKYMILSFFILLVITIIACSNIVSENKNNSTITGEIIEIHASSIVIQTDHDEKYAVALNNNTKYGNGVGKDFFIGNLVTIVFNGVVAESNPMQITAMEVTQNDPMANLDPREFVSGIIGEFPMVILDENNLSQELTQSAPFAISLSFPGKTNPWEYQLPPYMEKLGEGSNINAGNNTKTTYFWGFKSTELGNHQVKFTNKEDAREVIFSIYIKKE
ncbi:MAG: hypothetical protein ACOWWR_08395 [Eubacteriales bacterium]